MKLEMFVLVDEAGDYVIARERSELGDKWEEEIGGIPLGSRVIAITLDVSAAAQCWLSAVVPAQPEKATMQVNMG